MQLGSYEIKVVEILLKGSFFHIHCKYKKKYSKDILATEHSYVKNYNGIV
jgi:hypothetical protein